MQFGIADTSYKAAGQLTGLSSLSAEFYRIMASQSQYQELFDLHSTDINLSIDKLAYFLSGWLGGPSIYKDKFGSINIPGAHKHLRVGDSLSSQWLGCMDSAIDIQEYSPEFKRYLKEQLRIPVQRIKQVCAHAY